MYIKTLTIQGFKSYRDQTQIEPFSPKHNVVVGRNGSGKSNFFSAIRFVLSDAYTSMSREERQALLHEGVSTTTTLSAYVEIVFDNSDNRFPTGHEEVIIRRTIGLKKDEYSLDKKSVNKADIMNLLESAGFSKSNPYYIVPQGRITALTNAKDPERLTLLKEVAGTNVYEQRRTESLKIMAETDSKRAKIGELLEYIDSRLSSLEEEKEELKEYQDKDKERRCLEYALYQRELEEVGEALEDIEEERKGEVHGANVRREQFSDREKEIQDVERRIGEGTHALQNLALSRQDAQAELTDLIRSRTELECTLDDLKVATARSTDGKDALLTELQSLEEAVTDREAALQAILPEWETARITEATERRALDEANSRLSALYAKRGRASKFRTRAERDKYLKGEIKSMEEYQLTQAQALETAKTNLESLRSAKNELETQLGSFQTKVADGRTRAAELTEQLSALKDQQSELTERRKELWREDTKLESIVSRAADELRTAERVLTSMLDKDTGMGLRAVDKIRERHGLDGVYGPLFRLFEVTDPRFNTAIEQTAGNSLFHVVVDTDDTATKLLDIMLKEKTGRITLMPLNRLKPKMPPAPSLPHHAQDAEPLLSKLQYDTKHEKAFQQVFGKTWVCRDLTVAAAYVKSHGINTITLDGDRVDRKGALTGGYHDVRRSRIEAIRNVTMWKDKVESEEARLKEVKNGILRVEQEVTQLAGKISVLNGQQGQVRDARERMMEEGNVVVRERDKIQERIERAEKEVEELEMERVNVRARMDGYRQELGTDLVDGLTAQEEGLAEGLSREVEKRRKDVVELGRQKVELEKKKTGLEIELNERLRRRRDELRARAEGMANRIDQGDGVGGEEEIKTRERELRVLNNNVATLSKRVKDMEKETEDLNSSITTFRSTLEQLQNQQTEDGRTISRQQKTTERYLAKRQMLLTRRDECNRNIRDLGVLPEEAFEKYINEKLDRLVKKLHTVNESLKKFAHVNKKAFEQYSNFTKQRDQLLTRREDLETSAESIEELVQVLDQRKDEAIERTFKQVAKNFEEVFEKLVPAGRGRLIIQRRIDQDVDGNVDEDTDGEEERKGSVDNYTGVSIKVSFNSKSDEGLRISQLSGGQKSLVALALVFAIQKCDPAPFYLFDEIDANLDAQYRTAVASMIQSLSSTAQFITTTFRPEMLVTADKFYGVLFNNQKVSSIRAIKREEAMEFVDQETRAQ
ncbi:RecF/RecN/SMC [Amanita rubescens]|nr:RecF/RecN/SMC [Amanita rubescens]KAF8340026.1 RecF/RecN/SMC [Amanita rubescens]